MATKTRNYKIDKLKLVDIKGFLASSVIGLGVVASGTLTVIADEAVFTNLSGQITVAGKATSITSSNGEPVSIPNFETEFINKTAVIDPVTRQIVQDDSKSTRIFTITNISPTTFAVEVKLKMKGIRAFFATDITLIGDAVLVSEETNDATVPDTSTDTTAPSGPSTTVSGKFNPNLGISGLTYYWPIAKSEGTIVSALETMKQICASLGIPTGMLAFTLEVHSDGGRPGAGANWREHYASRCNMIIDVAKTIQSYGFGTVIYAWNSNTPGKGYSKSWPKNPSQADLNFILDNIRKMVKSIGTDWSCWSLCNESDSSTPTNFQSAIRALKSELNIPDNRYLSHDVHPKSVKSLPDLKYPDQTFTSDNGGIISELYESRDYWTAVGFNVDAHIAVINKYGTSVPKYFYNLVLSESIVRNKAKWYDVLKVFKSKIGDVQTDTGTSTGTNTNAAGLQPSQVTWLTSRGRSYTKAKTVFNITSAKIDGNRLKFNTDASFPSSWRKREKGVNAVGFLIRKIGDKYVGGKCEWCVESRGWYDIKTNVKDGYNGHTMPNSGETVWCGIGSPDDGSGVSSLVPVVWS